MKETETDDVRALGGIPLDIIQKYINFWYTYSLDLFGGEISSNSANFFAAGMKGRYREQELFEDHIAADGIVNIEADENNVVTNREIPVRNALNEVLRAEYTKDSERGLARWNSILAELGLSERVYLPSKRFHRHVGEYAGHHFDPQGNLISQGEFERQLSCWLPTMEDREYVRSLMMPVTEPGKIANWIAPPRTGINRQPLEFEYVRL
jgi:benzoyl-CoA 2,3-dioxygenase component B